MLKEALQIKEREIISLVGGGGKTTLMFAIARELAEYGRGIILTTTTKIWKPSSPQVIFYLNDQLSNLKKWVTKNLSSFSCVLLAHKELNNGKLQGLDPQWVDELSKLEFVSWIIVEADGAAGRSLKAPQEGEPVIPQSTTLLIPVVGVDVLGAPLEERYVFRSSIAMEILKVPRGSPISPAMIGKLLLTVCQNRPAKSRLIPFINKVDLEDGLPKARILARDWGIYKDTQISMVVLGQAQKHPVALEVYQPDCFPES